MLTLPRGHLLTPENLRDLANDAVDRATAATSARFSQVVWDDIDWTGTSDPAALDQLEASGRVIARVGHRYLLRPAP